MSYASSCGQTVLLTAAVRAENWSMSEQSVPGRRTLWALTAVVVLIVLAALIVQAARPLPVQYPAQTPEGTVQRYVTALLHGERDVAAEYLTNRSDDCERYLYEVPHDLQIQLKSAAVEGEHATLVVRIRYAGERAPLFGSDTGYEDRFELVKRGSWLISTAPWPVGTCQPGEPEFD